MLHQIVNPQFYYWAFLEHWTKSFRHGWSWNDMVTILLMTRLNHVIKNLNRIQYFRQSAPYKAWKKAWKVLTIIFHFLDLEATVLTPSDHFCKYEITVDIRRCRKNPSFGQPRRDDWKNHEDEIRHKEESVQSKLTHFYQETTDLWDPPAFLLFS